MHGFVFEEICLCLTSFAYGINACRLPKKTNIVFYSHVRWSHFSHAALANEKRERKKKKNSDFLSSNILSSLSNEKHF